ncbi:MAG: response regulator transcription factor [Balneolaceae bacterium]|nr:response regulator transcription factor [Balneolaceae bacterium]MBO6547363.1 response regulator transcription factor [Balneolaceae bacterium]MBO6647690.1 response regulator transcription factor [Balneolaceae bacterium]
MTKLVLVDDHKVFLQGMEALLSRTEDFEVIATYTDGLDLMRFLAEGELPDVLLLDIEMKSISGVEVADNVLKQYPSIRVIMLSTYFDEDFVQHLMESGISGYLLKSTGFPDLKAAITKVAEGSFAFSPEVMDVIVKGFGSKEKNSGSAQRVESNPLTDREVELIRLIADELTMKEIAEKLFLSEHTVKTHRKNIMAKMEVKNTAGMIKKAFILGLIE